MTIRFISRRVQLLQGPGQFARAVARPIVVERALRARFENDDRIHASQRQQAHQLRSTLLAAKRSNAPLAKLLTLLKETKAGAVNEITWHLTPRPAGDSPRTRPDAPLPSISEVSPATKSIDSPSALEIGPQSARVHSSLDHPAADDKLYFADLPTDMRRALRVQLQQPGDLSAVLETPQEFLLFLAQAKTPALLSAACVTIPKRSYEEWLARQAP